MNILKGSMDRLPCKNIGSAIIPGGRASCNLLAVIKEIVSRMNFGASMKGRRM